MGRHSKVPTDIQQKIIGDYDEAMSINNRHGIMLKLEEKYNARYDALVRILRRAGRPLPRDKNSPRAYACQVPINRDDKKLEKLKIEIPNYQELIDEYIKISTRYGVIVEIARRYDIDKKKLRNLLLLSGVTMPHEMWRNRTTINVIP